MITITACYMKCIRTSRILNYAYGQSHWEMPNDGQVTYEMWVEDAPHIKASGCESLEHAKDVLNYLIKEELSTMWRVTGEYEIVEYRRV